MKKYIWTSAAGNEDRSITYHDKDGNSMTRYLDPKATNPPRGSKSWRHQNPGNVNHGDFAQRHGEIGFACYPSPYDTKKKLCFAIFPDYETGRKAFAVLLKTERYIDIALNKFPRIYTGILKDEIPDTKEVIEYRKNLRLISKFDMERKIRSFVGEEFEKLLDAIQRCEGWFPGDETITLVEDKEKVVGVKYLKQKIVAFLVETKNSAKRWLTHPEAVALAKVHKLLAVVVRTTHGVYLRSCPNQPNFSEMEIR